MAKPKKKKSFWKKAAKAALIGGVGYLAAKGLGKRRKSAEEAAASETIKYTPGKQIPDIHDFPKRWNLGGSEGPPSLAAKGGRIGKKGGGRTGKQFGGGLNRPVARPIGGGLNRPVGGVGAPVRPMPYKHGGSVKSRGVAKRGGGAEIK